MAHLPAQSCPRYRCYGLVRCSHYRFSPALCIRRHPTRPQKSGLDQRHKESDGRMGCPSNNGGVSLGRGSGLHDPRPGSHLWHHRHTSIARHGHSGQANCTSLTLAEWLCRTVDRIDPARVLGPRYCFGRGTSASDSEILCRLLQPRQDASVFTQGCADFSSDSSDRNHSFTPDSRRASPSLRPGLSFWYTQVRRLAPISNHLLEKTDTRSTRKLAERLNEMGTTRSKWKAAQLRYYAPDT